MFFSQCVSEDKKIEKRNKEKFECLLLLSHFIIRILKLGTTGL